MDDNPMPNSQYALQLALQTLKERCVQLQKRINTLEEENLGLKLKNVKQSDNVSQESLDYRISKLTEEKLQLKNTIGLVANENKQLWSNLLQLTNENKPLETQISQIRDTLSPHSKAHTPLIRSKTFTQEAPHTKHLQKVLSENDKISLELEDISLKLQNSYSKEKSELEMQLFEMSNLTHLREDLGFNILDEELDDSMTESIEQHLLDLRNIKFILQQHNDTLKESVDCLDKYHVEIEAKQLEESKMKAEVNIPMNSVQIQVNLPLQEEAVNDHAFQLERERNDDKICPICNKKFHYDIDFDVFTQHVEEHFQINDVLRV